MKIGKSIKRTGKSGTGDGALFRRCAVMDGDTGGLGLDENAILAMQTIGNTVGYRSGVAAMERPVTTARAPSSAAYRVRSRMGRSSGTTTASGCEAISTRVPSKSVKIATGPELADRIAETAFCIISGAWLLTFAPSVQCPRGTKGSGFLAMDRLKAWPIILCIQTCRGRASAQPQTAHTG